MMLYALYNFASWDHSVLYEQFQDPDAVVGLADGGAHVAFICDASMPTYLLTHWVRDRTRGPRVPLAEAVRRVTSQTAELYGLTDRGRIAPGLRTDINVIDHASMTLSTPAAVHDLPVGGVRLLQSATGYDVTMVAGEVTRRHGVDTGARPDRLLRAGVSRPRPDAPTRQSVFNGEHCVQCCKQCSLRQSTHRAPPTMRGRCRLSPRARRSACLPFGEGSRGWLGESGFGRDGGRPSIDEFTRPETVSIGHHAGRNRRSGDRVDHRGHGWDRSAETSAR